MIQLKSIKLISQAVPLHRNFKMVSPNANFKLKTDAIDWCAIYASSIKKGLYEKELSHYN